MSNFDKLIFIQSLFFSVVFNVIPQLKKIYIDVYINIILTCLPNFFFKNIILCTYVTLFFFHGHGKYLLVFIYQDKYVL